MLDFSSLIEHIGGLADETARRASIGKQQIEIAIRCLREQASQPDAFDARLSVARQGWLKAKSMNAGDLWSCAISEPDEPTIYTALACDGSQIPLDRHEIAVFYLLNVGKVALHYGRGMRPLLTSAPKMAYLEQDLLGSTSDAEPNYSDTPRQEVSTSGYVNDKELAARRFILEMETLEEMISEREQSSETVAFADGTLILWMQESEPTQTRNLVLRRFLDVLERARECHVPIIGYLSKPASREVIGALRISLCADACLDSKKCVLRDSPHCSSIDRLTDAELFSHILGEGERTPLFRSESHILKHYVPVEQRIVFFYLNVGGEIARVEMPQWCGDDPELLDRCHSVALDQARKGFGYPVCLSEAHEQAIVRGPEREALLRMIEREFVRSNIEIARTAKAAAKRRRSI